MAGTTSDASATDPSASTATTNQTSETNNPALTFQNMKYASKDR